MGTVASPTPSSEIKVDAIKRLISREEVKMTVQEEKRNRAGTHLS
jgi:hypothetical protein